MTQCSSRSVHALILQLGCNQDKYGCIFDYNIRQVRTTFFKISTYINTKIVHTVTIIIFKQDANPVNVVHFAKIHRPPHRLVRRGTSYVFCSHTCCCVSVNSVACVVTCACKGCDWMANLLQDKLSVITKYITIMK